jgi:hypothetical protein
VSDENISVLLKILDHCPTRPRQTYRACAGYPGTP